MTAPKLRGKAGVCGIAALTPAGARIRGLTGAQAAIVAEQAALVGVGQEEQYPVE